MAALEHWTLYAALACTLGCSLDSRVVDTLPGASQPTTDTRNTGGTAASSPGVGVGDETLGYPLRPGSAGAAGVGPAIAGSAGAAGVGPAAAGSAGAENGVSLTVSSRGDGFGSVRVSVGSSEPVVCSPRCSALVSPGVIAAVTAEAGPYSVVQSWSEPGCGGPTCVVPVDASTDLSVEFQLAHNVAFLSSQSYLPTELPRAGVEAGAECARLAAAAGLHGTRWVAWLSAEGPTEAAEDDVNARDFFQHTGGWVRSDGQPVARSLSTLTSGQLLQPINLTESRGFAPSNGSWAGTGLDGNAARAFATGVSDCQNWSTNAAAERGSDRRVDGVGEFWTGASESTCDSRQPITCLGDDSDAELDIVPAAGRLAFLTAGEFTPGAGVAAADLLCQREACEAGLTGSGNCAQTLGVARTFLSYLHLQARRAWERFNLDGPTWVRRDGVPWLESASVLAQDAPNRLSALNLTLDLRYLGEGRTVWLGDVAGQATCADWSSTAGLGGASVYDAVTLASLTAGDPSQECSLPARLYCLEE